MTVYCIGLSYTTNTGSDRLLPSNTETPELEALRTGGSSHDISSCENSSQLRQMFCKQRWLDSVTVHDTRFLRTFYVFKTFL